MENSSAKTEKIIGIGAPKSLVDVLGDTSEKMAGKWGHLIGLCSVAGVSCLLLLMFPVLGFGLSFFASGFLMLGLNRAMLAVLKGKTPPVEDVFSMWKHAPAAFALRTLQLFFVALWTLLLIVPGMVAALNYSFAFAVMADNPEIDAIAALQKSKSMVYGYRRELFLIYLYIFLIVALVFATALMIPFLFTFWTFVPTAWMFGTAGILTFFVFMLAILPYSEVILLSFYIEVKGRQRKKDQPVSKRKSSKTSADVLALDSDIPLVEKALKRKTTKKKDEK